ncbi:hypothetical protein ABZ079_13875 [Streptomyces sp. NPDC006314]|uniref:hypothetical protein n=1 Tax=Streptomyces sp. NPDC006314 TaxID=3154475 RepID=UPI0033B7BAE0
MDGSDFERRGNAVRKLREAALVAAMVGSISVFGVSVASAHGSHGGDDGDKNTVKCDQRSEVNYVTYQNGLVNVPLPLVGSGPATATSPQQTCSGRDSNARNEATAQSGTATGGDGTTPPPPPNGELDTFQVAGPEVTVPEGGEATATATCPAGSVVTGGGFVVTTSEAALNYDVREDQRGPGESWQVTLEQVDEETEAFTFHAVAECATSS